LILDRIGEKKKKEWINAREVPKVETDRELD
jgi:hypothetical protein